MIEFAFLDLPIPPSVNRLWRSGRGRVFRSEVYNAWREEAGWELVRQKPARLKGWVSITIAAGQPDRRRRDLDNISSKALLDLLVAHQVIEDDSKVAAISSRWDSLVTPGRLQVEVKPAAAPERRTLTETTPMSKLTEKQQRFINAFLQCGNASQAYRTAYKADGMSPGAVKVEASRLLRNKRIAQRLAELRQDDAGQAGLPDSTLGAQANPEPPTASLERNDTLITDAEIIDNPKVDPKVDPVPISENPEPDPKLTLTNSTSDRATLTDSERSQSKTRQKPKTARKARSSNGIDPNPPNPPKSKPKQKPKSQRAVYSAKLTERICLRVALGESLRGISLDPGMPSNSVMHKWRSKYPDFEAHYVRAREARADARSDEMDQIRKDMLEGKITSDVARTAMDSLKWLAGREMPKRYGDRLAVEASASPAMMKIDDERSRRELSRRLIYLLGPLVQKAQEAKEARETKETAERRAQWEPPGGQKLLTRDRIIEVKATKVED